jgi:hypothetical protein
VPVHNAGERKGGIQARSVFIKIREDSCVHRGAARTRSEIRSPPPPHLGCWGRNVRRYGTRNPCHRRRLSKHLPRPYDPRARYFVVRVIRAEENSGGTLRERKTDRSNCSGMVAPRAATRIVADRTPRAHQESRGPVSREESGVMAPLPTLGFFLPSASFRIVRRFASRPARASFPPASSGLRRPASEASYARRRPAAKR